ncbi:hypothetical protein FIBSPDRAFT_869892, partial [Athelia psychrophila]
MDVLLVAGGHDGRLKVFAGGVGEAIEAVQHGLADSTSDVNVIGELTIRQKIIISGMVFLFHSGQNGPCFQVSDRIWPMDTHRASSAPPSAPFSKGIPFPPNPESFMDMDDESGCSYRSEMQGIIAMIGVLIAIIFGIVCIVVGIYISDHNGQIQNVVLPPGGWRDSTLKAVQAPYAGMLAVLPDAQTPSAILSLLLAFMVTLSTESIGFVHSVALKSTLASNAQLTFNTNPRLFYLLNLTHWKSPNGPLFNAAMASLLTLSYASSSLCFILVTALASNSGEANTWSSTCIFGAPFIILGAVILLQAAIATYSIVGVKVLTWSSSPFDTAVALLRNGLIIRRSGRSMHTVVDVGDAIAPPRTHQPSAWQSHPAVRKVVAFLWLLSFACAVWGGTSWALWNKDVREGSMHGFSATPGSWDLAPNNRSSELVYDYGVDLSTGFSSWPIVLALFTVSQGALTFGLHCAELNVNILRDELYWRQAATPFGLVLSRNPFTAVLGSWPNLALLVAKPFLHWLFGCSMTMVGQADPTLEPMLR